MDGIGCSCGCDEEGSSGTPILPPSQDPRETIEVVGVGDIQVTPSYGMGGKKIFSVALVPYAPPKILATADPLFEVGTVNDFEWNVTIQQTVKPIVLRTITPVPAPPVDLTAPFELSVENDTKSVKGFNQHYAIQVKDSVNTIVNRNIRTNYVNKVFQGFTFKDGVSPGLEYDESDILGFTGTLAENIKTVYGGAHNYVFPVVAYQQYIVWFYEVGTTPITGMTLSGQPFPLTFIPGTIPVTNPHNGAIVTQYAAVRSANKFVNGTLSIVML